MAFLLAFGVLVEIRSAYMRRRMTDLNCYLRAAWAVRQGGADLYHVFDDNGWHYNYPPLFAILLTPLADPPTQDLSVVAGNVVGLAGSPLAIGPPWLPLPCPPAGHPWGPITHRWCPTCRGRSPLLSFTC